MDRSIRCVVYRMSRLEVLRKIRLRSALKGLGLHFKQPPILEYVMKNDGCTQNDIAEALHVTPASIATSTKRMQHAGLITKRADETNLRCNRLTLTDRGMELVKMSRSKFDSVNESIFEGFSEDELELLANMLDRMLVNISDDSAYELDLRQLIAIEEELSGEECDI